MQPISFAPLALGKISLAHGDSLKLLVAFFHPAIGPIFIFSNYQYFFSKSGVLLYTLPTCRFIDGSIRWRICAAFFLSGYMAEVIQVFSLLSGNAISLIQNKRKYRLSSAHLPQSMFACFLFLSVTEGKVCVR